MSHLCNLWEKEMQLMSEMNKKPQNWLEKRSCNFDSMMVEIF